MQVQSLGRVDPLKEEMATHSISFLENLTDRGACTVHGVTESDMTEVTQHTQSK